MTKRTHPSFQTHAQAYAYGLSVGREHSHPDPEETAKRILDCAIQRSIGNRFRLIKGNTYGFITRARMKKWAASQCANWGTCAASSQSKAAKRLARKGDKP